jgi:glycosyltransferase EpsE
VESGMIEVSVLMPVYNENIFYLEASIKSILNQSYSNFELLILDDSDKVEVIQLIDRFASGDRRIRVHRSPYRIGLTKSLNYGIKNSSGIFLARADSDDFSHTDRLEKQHHFLIENPNVSVVGSSILKINDLNHFIGYRYYEESHREISKKALFQNPMCHPTVMFRRSVLLQYGCYDEKYDYAEDYELWRRFLSKNVQFHNLLEPLVSYRIPAFMKRPKANWLSVLKIKVKYFDMNFKLRSLYGIIVTTIIVLLPMQVYKLAYQNYNRIN